MILRIRRDKDSAGRCSPCGLLGGADPLGRGAFVTGVDDLPQDLQALAERGEEGMVGQHTQ